MLFILVALNGLKENDREMGLPDEAILRRRGNRKHGDREKQGWGEDVRAHKDILGK